MPRKLFGVRNKMQLHLDYDPMVVDNFFSIKATFTILVSILWFTTYHLDTPAMYDSCCAYRTGGRSQNFGGASDYKYKIIREKVLLREHSHMTSDF